MMEELFKLRKEKLLNFKRIMHRERKVQPRIVPDHLFVQCSKCNEAILQTELDKNFYVCPYCGKPLRIDYQRRLESIVDCDSFHPLFSNMTTSKSFDFPGYQEKLKKQKELTGLKEAFICGSATIGSIRVCIGVLDSRFFMGSMGSVVGEKVTALIEYATKKKLPLIIYSASGGARMQEGIYSLMQMAKTSGAISQYKKSGGLFISFLTDPTYGGVTASFSMLGDINLAEPQAMIGFAGPRVIAQTIKRTLPEGFQTAEFLLEHGYIDAIVGRNEARDVLYKILSIHGGNKS